MSPAMAITNERSDDDVSPQNHQYLNGVKQLYENGLRRVPNKYIFPASDRPNHNTQHPNLIQLPIIDFSQLKGPNRPRLLHSLSHACEHYGFFQVVNHGIGEDVMRKMMDVCRRFFDLPFEERGKYITTDMEAPVRYGTSFSATKDRVLCWRDFLKLMCHPLPDFLPHWPSSPADLRKLAATYAQETKYLFLTLMEGILESLGIVGEETEELKQLMEDGSHMMMANYYPPCPEPELTLGIPPHSDYGFLTLLLQDQVEGLQIQHQAQWLTVQPLPNTFVVNVGDHLEIFSNGKYKSVVHRVLVNGVKHRISVASLHSLPFSSTVRAWPKLISETNPKKYKDTGFGDFLDYVSTREHKRKDFLDSRKLY
ncbi:protein DMR6-LIKE OXYGENASE 1 [Senna tora]|uniref:Protein DMR6-LIKE OXYGENASE 1 n=1 Tax=Senna tora TaxID=362788 RepID=A0A834W0A1_9FABA|nr:protein DMR6-LIKE OXYGENASE 1 [Senna tora]